MEKRLNDIIIDGNYRSPLLKSEVIELKELQKSFINSYYENMDCIDIEKWLAEALATHLPEKNNEEIKEMSKGIITTIVKNDLSRDSLEKAVAIGRSKESWFATSIKNDTAHMGVQEAIEYMSDIDKALNLANIEMYNTRFDDSTNIYPIGKVKEELKAKETIKNWNEYEMKDFLTKMGKKTALIGLQGAATNSGFNIVSEIWHSEEIESKQVIESTLKSGTDMGIKAASAGALKVGVEKGVIKAISKDTSTETIANIAYVGVENVKIIKKVASGEMTVDEGLNEMEKTTVSTIAEIGREAGESIGKMVGTVFGPGGVALGGAIGGNIGYMAGHKVGEVIVKTARKIEKKAEEVVRTVVAKSVGKISNVLNNFSNVASSIFNW